MVDRGEFATAQRETLEDALRLRVDPVEPGQSPTGWGIASTSLVRQRMRIGTCGWRGTSSRSSTRSMPTRRTCWGRSRRTKRPEEANSFYEVVLTSHPDAKVAAAARLGRGVCRIHRGRMTRG